MRRTLMAGLLAMLILVSGCSRKKSLSDIPYSDTMTVQDYEDQVGARRRLRILAAGLRTA